MMPSLMTERPARADDKVGHAIFLKVCLYFFFCLFIPTQFSSSSPPSSSWPYLVQESSWTHNDRFLFHFFSFAFPFFFYSASIKQHRCVLTLTTSTASQLLTTLLSSYVHVMQRDPKKIAMIIIDPCRANHLTCVCSA